MELEDDKPSEAVGGSDVRNTKESVSQGSRAGGDQVPVVGWEVLEVSGG